MMPILVATAVSVGDVTTLLCDLPRNDNRFFPRHPALYDSLRQRRPFHELHHQRQRSFGFLNSMQRRDVRVIE